MLVGLNGLSAMFNLNLPRIFRAAYLPCGREMVMTTLWSSQYSQRSFPAFTYAVSWRNRLARTMKNGWFALNRLHMTWCANFRLSWIVLSQFKHSVLALTFHLNYIYQLNNARGWCNVSLRPERCRIHLQCQIRHLIASREHTRRADTIARAGLATF